jgi:sirohydrochlorin ferrochelatase
MTPRVITIGLFLSCGLSLVALQVVARMPTRMASAWVCDLQTLFARLMARRATRVAVVLAWAWLGWHFLVTPPQ